MSIRLGGKLLHMEMAMNFANQLKAFFNYYFVNYLTIKTLIDIISNK